MELTKLSAGHLDEIVKIEQAVFKQPWSAQAFRDVIREGLPSWVAEEAGVVCGYLITLWVESEVHILNIATSPALRKHGVATMLLDHLYRRAYSERMKTVYLEVRISNFQAISLYRKYGLGVLTVRKRYYGDGEDAYVMCGPVHEPRSSAGIESQRTEGAANGD